MVYEIRFHNFFMQIQYFTHSSIPLPDFLSDILFQEKNKMIMRSRIASMFGLFCPACRQGRLFVRPELFWDYSFRMHDRCPHCGESFVREPGFYYGAMFISYIISAFFSLAFAGLLILVCNVYWKYALALLILTLAFFFSYLYKLSRSIWIHFFVKQKK